MIVTLEIPDEVSSALCAGFQNLSRSALEALAAEAYAKDILSLEQVRTMLALDSIWDAQQVLCDHAAWSATSAEEILTDAATSAAFRARIS